MTKRNVTSIDAAPTQFEADFFVGLLRERIEQKLEALKTRAHAGELVDLNEIDARTNLATHFAAYQASLRREAFGDYGSAFSSSARRGPRRGH
jgi:hypothetical protein